MCYCEGFATCRTGSLSEAEKYRLMYIICTQKTQQHILVTAPLSSPDATLHIHLTTQKTPQPFGRGADIVANNINYFSSLIACAIYAFFASFAALFASRLTFK